MAVIFIICIILLLTKTKFFIKENNTDYLSKKQTTIINGMFVILVFYSHFSTYISNVNIIDKYLLLLISHVGQLMVTTFLFYSGYGIYESIKRKANYQESFFKKRFLPTFINFSIAILLFIIVNIFMNIKYSKWQILLSFTGWESIGNSNWYMFAIFSEYLFLILSFMLFKKEKNQIRCVTVLTIIYIFIVSYFKESHWVNTILCFPIGMYYSYYKKNIENILLNKKKTNKISICLIILFMLLYLFYQFFSNLWIYNIISISFISLILVFSLKIKFSSKVFEYLGSRVFWIYILQRIPMIILKDKLDYQLYFVVCLIITIILSEVLYRITNKLNNKLLSIGIKNEKEN